MKPAVHKKTRKSFVYRHYEFIIIISSSSRCMYALLYSVFVCFSANLMKHPNVGHAYEMIRVCFQVVPKAEKLLT